MVVRLGEASWSHRVALISLVAAACVDPGSATPPVDTSGEGTTTSTLTTDTQGDDTGTNETGTNDTGTNDTDTNDTGTDSTWTGYFPPESPWYKDVRDAAKDPDSDAIISWLNETGWGLGRAQIDFSFEILQADADTPKMAFEPTDDFYEPDCDHVEVPIPEDGNLEGETGYRCDSDGDCHLIVVDRQDRSLYEMWRANIENGVFYGGCLAKWTIGRLYGPNGRGQQCTSADAAGFPIAPLLVNADEVASGSINHALRFILPNSSIRAGEYVTPATHGTSATSGPGDAPPYGAHLRLRADFPVENLPNEASRVVARALQTYGMFLADGGNVLFTFQSDRHTTAKWADLLEPRDLELLTPGDFEVLDLGDPIPLTNDCVRE
jgi:serine/threonine-protein kinase